MAKNLCAGLCLGHFSKYYCLFDAAHNRRSLRSHRLEWPGGQVVRHRAKARKLEHSLDGMEAESLIEVLWLRSRGRAAGRIFKMTLHF